MFRVDWKITYDGENESPCKTTLCGGVLVTFLLTLSVVVVYVVEMCESFGYHCLYKLMSP